MSYKIQSKYIVSPNSVQMMDRELLYKTSKTKLNSQINEMLILDKKQGANIEREFIDYQDITGGYEFTMIAREVE